MARNPNVRGRQVVRFYTTGKRAAQEFGLPAYLRGLIGRYDDIKKQAVATVSQAAESIATDMIVENYTIPRSELAGRVRTANTADTFRMFASSLRFPLSLFNGRWNGPDSAGATAEIVRGNTKLYQHAFMAPGRFRGRSIGLIYSRTGGHPRRMQYGRYAGQMREPIRNLRGPSTYQMIIGTDQGGAEKWVRLREPLTKKLRDMFFAEVIKRQSSEGANGG